MPAPSLSRFVAAEVFKIGNLIGARKLSAVGLNFAHHFLAVVETYVPVGTIKAWNLLYTAGDKSLIAEIRRGRKSRRAVLDVHLPRHGHGRKRAGSC